MQGVLFYRGAVVPLAVLLLSELWIRPDPGLDERDLPHVGSRPRGDHRHPRELVPGLVAAKIDDGPAGLRRRRQPRPDPDSRQGSQAPPASPARPLGLS